MNRTLPKTIVGRIAERKLLDTALNSPDAELIAVYGRRRIGKTFLVSTHLNDSIAFQLSGLHGATTLTQLANFGGALQKHLPNSIAAQPATWLEAFATLEERLTKSSKRTKRKQVIFLDEFPWLSTHRSGFLTAFENFWNTFASRRSDIMVVICGSSAAWMIRKVLHARGGLHNRVTRRINLMPFDLYETRQYLQSRNIDWTDEQIAILYMAIGGVPHYLNLVERGQSAAQVIQQQCFEKNGFLRDEYDQLYAALFENYAIHESIVRCLASTWVGQTRGQLLVNSKLNSGGGFTTALEELVHSGFVGELPARGNQIKDTVYRLSDEYSLFYWNWIAKSKLGDAWTQKSTGKKFNSWRGYAFEALCLKHIDQIKKALDIAAVETHASSWRQLSTKKDSVSDEGAQIDLVLDRADRCTNLCEMKFTDGLFTITKAYAAELEKKMRVFRQHSKSRNALFLTLITSQGLIEDANSTALVSARIQLADLFRTMNT
jgi:uncharacterized protein